MLELAGSARREMSDWQSQRERVARLYRELGPVVYRRCVRLLGDKDAARDATQEVFVKLLRQDAPLEEGVNALRFIYRVTTNHCLNVRRERLRRGTPAGGGSDEALEVAVHSTVAYPERRLAQQVLGRFDATTQAVAVGVLVDGMEREEIAGILGLSRRTVQRKLARFLAQARKLVGGEGP